MIYLILWLFIGNIAYSYALALRLYELDQKIEPKKRRLKQKHFNKGLLAILLGPIAFYFIEGYKK